MDKTVIFKRFGKWYATPESNYNATIMDENKVTKCRECQTENGTVEALVNWANIKRENIIIKY